MRRTSGVGGVVHAERQVECSQGVARDIADFAAEERAEGRVHGEVTRPLGQIHTRGQHGDGQFSALVGPHSLQFAVQLHILGRIQRELKSHVVERLGNLDATVEVDAAPYPVAV